MNDCAVVMWLLSVSLLLLRCVPSSARTRKYCRKLYRCGKERQPTSYLLIWFQHIKDYKSFSRKFWQLMRFSPVNDSLLKYIYDTPEEIKQIIDNFLKYRPNNIILDEILIFFIFKNHMHGSVSVLIHLYNSNCWWILLCILTDVLKM